MKNKNNMYEAFVKKAREIYGPDFIPLHRPVFEGNEINYLKDCIKSNFVSSSGNFVSKFELAVEKFTGSKHAIAVVNGTSALHIAMLIAGVKSGDEVITQALTFVATCNAISYLKASPVFVDVDKDTMGMSPEALKQFLKKNTFRKGGNLYNKSSKRPIRACVPMHTYGIPCRINEIAMICEEWGIALVEDAAESFGSFSRSKHTGTIGTLGVFSFNGNKIITSGGGGMIITDQDDLAIRAKHITTTAKVPHPTEFVHDEIGYNYRMPGLCAALGVAQMEKLEEFLTVKEYIAQEWRVLFKEFEVELNKVLPEDRGNNWFNSITLDSVSEKNDFLNFTNDQGVMTRPLWELMSNLKMFKSYEKDTLLNSKWLLDRVVAISSSVPDNVSNDFKSSK